MNAKRWLMLVLLALFPLFAGAMQLTSFPVTVNGELTTSDPRDSGGYYSDQYEVSVVPGQTLTIDMTTTSFDSYLFLLNSQGTIVASNDDYGSTRASRIVYPATSSETMYIFAYSYSPGVTGSYTLSVQSTGGAIVLTPPQTVSGALASTDTASVSRPGGRADHYQISLQAGQIIVVDHASSAFDAYLAILDSSRTQVLASNDDNGTSLNSRITFTALSAGTYFIEATALSTTYGTGSYTLSVQNQSSGDTQAPSVPANLTVSQSGSSHANLAWSASTDNVGVTSYQVYRNGTLMATTSGTSYATVTPLAASTTHVFTVSACDAANNCSPQGSPVSLTLTSTAAVLTASYTASTLNGVAPLTVNFTGQGSSSLATDTLSYSWNFGDGQTSTERNPSHTYTTAGSYAVTLTVRNATGQSQTSSSQTVTVTQPNANLTASFTVSTLNGTAPLAVNFTGQGASSLSSDTLSYSWNFGDGQTSTERNPSHSYTTAGAYTVTLTVSNARGQSQTSSGQTITVTQPNANLTASFTASALSGAAPLAVTFTGQGASSLSTDTLTYSWNFGDGQTSTERNPSHSYTTAGTYTVTLAVTSGVTGQSVSANSQTVTVSRANVTVTGKARLRPQVIMGGFDPILLNLADDSFKLIAIVRPGAARITSVQTTNNAGGFSTAMSYAGTYDNGDQLYEVVVTYPRFAFPENTVMGDLFGTEAAQFQMQVVDYAQQRHSFPHLEFGNNTQLSTRPTSPSTLVSSTPGVKRPRPQVLVAGFDPQLIDLEDTSFDAVAVVRAGLVPIRTVSISTNNGGFSLAMNFVETLPNGDSKYKVTYTYPRGAFPAMVAGDLFGTAPGKFNIVVTDEAHQTHRFPELRAGNYPALEP